MNVLFQRLLRFFAPLRLPGQCALCGGAAPAALCTGCAAGFVTHAGARCACCAIGLSSAAPRCGDCLANAPAFDATIAAADYGAPLDQLVLGLKFGARLAHAPLLAGLMRDALLQACKQDGAPLPELLLAVPLGAARLRERGFNQAHEIARALARLTGIPLQTGMPLRARETAAQSGLQLDARHSNMAGAFAMPAEAAGILRGRHVGVVDDVMTTGATLAEMAALLKRFGAGRVTNIVALRTPLAR